MEIKRLDDTTSTNDYLLNNSHFDSLCVVADYQSAGKGMGTNTWESEAGKNLLFSILIHPTWLEAKNQYLLSMAEALALYDVLSGYTDGITIKWPNDIYWKDRKISGTRIDGNIKGRHMAEMVIGTGININQTTFLSDAPNPVSLAQITGREHDTAKILREILERFEHYLALAEEQYAAGDEGRHISTLYHSHLYRREGFHAYEDDNGTFEAEIAHVQQNGIMTLRCRNGEERHYEFKEVKFR